MRRVLQGVGLIEQRSVVEGSFPNHCASVAVVDVPENVDLGLDLVNFLPQLGAAGVDSFGVLVQDEVRRSVRDEQVDALRDCRPQHFCLGAVVLESPVVEERLVGRPEDLDTFDLDSLMLQVYAVLFQLLQLHLRIQFLMRMALGLVLGGVVVDVVDEVVVAGDDYLVLVGKGVEEGDEAVELAAIAVLGEVASVDEDVGLGKLADVEIFMQVVGVAHGQDPQLPRLLHLQIYKRLLNHQPFTIIILTSYPTSIRSNPMEQMAKRMLPGQARIELLILLLNIYLMKRPQSAKMGMRGQWANTDEASQHNISNKNFSKKNVVLMKPDLTSHDFSRILPKKIHQDKERLYSETLQLKQSVNDLTEENIRLKTKISILEKEKSRMGKYLENAQEMPSKKSQSRLNLYASKISDKQNNIIQSLKKLVREAKEEIEYLKSENLKTKKTMKYTKVNEVEIEKKILFDENKRVSQMLEEMTQHITDQQEIERENGELKKYLEEEMEENKAIAEENQKYEEIVEELENKIRAEVEKYQNREKKLTRDLGLEKRKNQENQKYIEDLRRELNQLRNTIAEGEKPKPAKPIVRPATSIANKRYTPNQAVHKRQQTSKPTDQREETIPNDEIGKSETEEIKVKNSQLEVELKQIKSKLERSENELKERAEKQREEKENLLKALAEKESFKKKEAIVVNVEPAEKVTEVRVIRSTNQGKPEASSDRAAKSPIKQEEQSYNDGFEKEQESYNYEQQFEKVDDDKQSRLQEQIQKVKQDFEENEEEEQIYKKEEPERPKTGGKKKKKKQEDGSGKKGAYKPNKKVLSEIKELLTYRMKGQRYPFEDLKVDIEQADLCDMLVNEPFLLSPVYTKALLSYCYQSEKVGSQDLLKSETLVAKLRKVIEQFELLDEEEEKEMIVRISEMTCSYPQELEAAFENIKNGEDTVSKANLIQMFEKLELEMKYIELIIAELSLCSSDMEHLNFHGFFERFYIEDEEENDQMAQPIEEQGEESEESYREAGRKKKSAKNTKKNSDDEEEDYRMGHYMMAAENRVAEKEKRFDDEDIVSDDGRI